MGQKVNPKAFRLAVNNSWSSRWFADNRRYKQLLLEDYKLRQALFARLKRAGLAEVGIDRSINKIDIILFVSRPGMVIGRGGSGTEELKKILERQLKIAPESRRNEKKGAGRKLELRIEPVKEPYLNAFLVGQMISDQLIKRISHKRAVNQALEKVMGSGAKGVRVKLSGRIAGAEISRRETYGKGSIPFSTLRKNLDFASVPSLTKSGYIGVKVWIHK